MKYQSEGGPSLKDCFDLLRKVSSAPVNDLQAMLNAVIFNFIIGNYDAHGKNFSLIHDNLLLIPEKKLRGDSSEIRLAPLYDLVCTAIYPDLSKKMAMKIGREYKSSDVSAKDFERMAEDIGFAKPLVKARVKELAQKVLMEIENIDINHPVAKEVANHIKGKCNAFLKLFEE
jgi:serine/threonine-protein kinase HipA